MAIAIGQFTIYDMNDIIAQPTAPLEPQLNQVWLDTSVEPPLLKTWNGSSWVVANDVVVGGRNILRNTALVNSDYFTFDNGTSLDTIFKFENNNTIKFDVKSSSFDRIVGATPNVQSVSINEYYSASASIFIPTVNGMNEDTYIALEIQCFNVLGDCISTFTKYVDKSIINGWQRIKLENKLIPVGTTSATAKTYVRGNGSFWVANIQLERGSKATDWTPATEDIDESIDNVKKLAEEADKNAQQGIKDAELANQKLTEIASDKLLTPSEKQQISRMWEEIKLQKPSIIAQANVYQVSTSKFETSYNSLSDYIVTLDLGSQMITEIVPNTFNTKFNTYYEERQWILDEVAKKTKEYANSVVDSIVIGGTNLVANTSFVNETNGWGYWNSATGKIVDVGRKNTNKAIRVDLANQSGSGVSTPITQCNGSTEYTVSFWAKLSKDGKIGDLLKFRDTTNTNETNPIPAQFIDAKANTWTYYSHTFTTPSNTGYVYSTPRIDSAIGTANMWITEYQMEIGNKATDWTPAYEDIVFDISLAQSLAEKAEKDAETAKGEADKANGQLSDIASDSKLTASEKQQISRNWEEIKLEKPSVVRQANVYGVSVTDYETAYNSLTTYVGTLGLTSITPTTIDKTVFNSRFNTYYEKRQIVLDNVATKSKEYATSVGDNIVIGGRNLLRNSTFTLGSDGKENWISWSNTWSIINAEIDKPKSRIIKNTQSGISTNQIQSAISRKNKCQNGEYYVYSMDIKVDDFNAWDVKAPFIAEVYDSTGARIQYKDVYITDMNLSSMDNGKWYRVSYILKINNENADTIAMRITLFRNGTLYVREPQLELGTKATNWSPAPEDMDNGIAIMLSNEAQVIPTNKDRLPFADKTYSTNISVYQGGSQRTDFTIGTITSANGITVTKTSSQVDFKVSSSTVLTQDDGTFTIPITIDDKTYNKIFSWACSKQGDTGATGSSGASAKQVIVNGGQVFKYVNNYTGNPTPTSIQFRADLINTTGYQWSYRTTSQTTPTNISGATSQTYDLTHNNSIWGDNKQLVLRCTSGGVYDEITIVKVSDGAQGNNGANGSDGKGIKTITEYYLATSSSTGVTTSTSGWTESIQSMTTTNKYLWNYERVDYTDGTYENTIARIIGVYGNTGNTGSAGSNGEDGNGVTSIVNYYLATNSSSGVTTSTSGWTTTIQTMTSTNKYLWNYEKITYSKTGVTNTTPCIIGVYGDKGETGDSGRGIKSTSVTYQSSSSGTTVPTGTWSTSIPTVSAGQYLWTRTITTYTDDSSTTSYSVGRMGTNGSNGSNGADGSDGKGVKSTTIDYQSSTNGTNAPTGAWSSTIPSVSAGNYLWTRTTITYTDNTTSTSYSVGKMGADGSNGTNGSDGKGIKTITEYYLATSLSSGVTTSTSGWTTTIQTMTTTNKYLWNYEVIAYTDNSTTTGSPKIIGAYGNTGSTGSTGATGNGISSIVNYYLATSASTGVTTSTSGWTDSIQAITPVNKYLWNYERVNYTNGGNTTTIPCIIGTYGDKGENGTNGTNGTNGQDAYTVILSNENHAFVAENNGSIASATSIVSNVIAYKGATKIAPTNVTWTNPSGMTITKGTTTNNEIPMTITANTGTSLATSGSVDLTITVDGKTFVKAFSWSKALKGNTGADGSNGTNGSNGQDAKTCDIVANSTVFKSSDGGTTFTPTNIELTPTLQSVTFSKWQYSLNGSTWVDVTSGQNGLTISSGKLTIANTSSLFTKTQTSISFKCITNVSTVYDVMTIVKLYDVADIEIGGTNLLKNTALKVNVGWSFSTGVTLDTTTKLGDNNTIKYDITGVTTDSWRSATPSAVKINIEKKHSASCEYYIPTGHSINSGASLEIQWFNSDNTRIGTNSKSLSTTTLDKWQTVKIEDVTPPTGSVTANARVWVRQSGKLWVANIKLEEGTKASAWSPSPNDKVENTQQDVFNTLTNNGTLQGIFMNGGDLFINGSKIKANSIDATSIKTDTLTANMITSGTFTGVNFKAGGNGNDGSFIAHDTSNNIVFSATKNGVYAKSLSFVDEINFDGTFRTARTTTASSYGLSFYESESNSSYSIEYETLISKTGLMVRQHYSNVSTGSETSYIAVDYDKIVTQNGISSMEQYLTGQTYRTTIDGKRMFDVNSGGMTVGFDTDTSESVIQINTRSKRAGMYISSGDNFGLFDWTNGRSILQYNFANNAVTLHGKNVMYAISGNGGYFGMAPNGSETSWVRTTTAGIIPNKSGGGGGSLGTSSWYFDNVWSTALRATGGIVELYTGYGTNYLCAGGTGDSLSYGTNNMRTRCHYGWGISDNYDNTNAVIDARGGRFIGKSAYWHNSSKELKSDVRVVMSESEPMAMNLREYDTIDQNISIEMIEDFLDTINIKTYISDFRQVGVKQEDHNDENANITQLGYIADEFADHPLFPYIGEMIGGLHAINTTALISAVIAGYKSEKRKRMKLEHEIDELEQRVAKIENILTK